MKKYFTCKLLLLTLVVFGWVSNVSAQDYRVVKHWDLLTWSEETIANLDADVTNWEVSSRDTETNEIQRYKTKVTNPAVLVANGVVIKETKGLEFPSLSAGNINIRHNFQGNGLQFGSSNQKITIKSLKKGQKVVIVLKSTNNTARGISAVTNMTGEVGESTWNELGESITYDLTVDNDGDATFTYSGGIILQDIKVSEVAKKVAFVYQTNYSTTWDIANDPIRLALEEAYAVTNIEYPNTTSESAEVVNAAMQAILDANYDLVVVSEAIGGTNSYGLGLKNIVGKVPMLNMKSFFYHSGRWSWGTGANPATKGTIAVTVEDAYKVHPIFDGVTIGEDGTCEIFGTSVSDKNQMQAYSGPAAIIAGDPILAKVGDLLAIHEHESTGEATDYRYILIPISSDALIGNFSDNGLKLVMNTVAYLANPSSYYVYAQAETPIISSAQNEALVTVTITTTTEGASIYYTTDGSVPTTSSSLYTAPFNISKPCTVKAVAVKDGARNSEVASEDIANPNYTPREKTLLWTDFNEQPDLWGVTGDIIAADVTDEKQIVGFTIGSEGQRINLQTTGVSEEVGGNYGPATEADTGASKYALSFLKGTASAYLITPTATGPFDVTIWWCGAKSASYTESLVISVKTAEATDWTEIGTLSTNSFKQIVKRSVSYNGNETVAVKIASSSTNGANNNAMIFDVKLMGEGVDTGIAGNVNDNNKVVVAKEYYDLMGKKLSSKEAAPINTILIEKSVYEDGSIGYNKIRCIK